MARKRVSRKEFLRLMGALGGGATLARCAPQGTPTAGPGAATQGPTALPATPIPVATATAAGPKFGGSLVYGQAGDYNTWDPYITRAVSYPIYHNLFDNLVNFDDKSTLRPCLAESWDITEDGKVIAFHLVQGVKFQNGEVFDAQAMARNFERARDESVGHDIYTQTMSLESWEVLDDYTIETHWAHPTAQWADILGWMGIMAPEMIEGDVKVVAIGTGPFKLGEWVPEDHATWAKNAEYWKAPLPYLDEVVTKPFSDASAMLASFEAGTLDIVNPVPFADVGRLRDDPNFLFYLQDPGLHYHFTLNCKREPWDKNTKARQAMQYVVNRQAIVENVLYNVGEPLLTPFGKESWVYDSAFDDYYSYDLDKARQLLSEAGVPEGLEVTIKTLSAFPEFPEMATILQADMAQVGINASVEAQETSIWYDDYYNCNYDINLLFSGETAKDPSGIFVCGVWRIEENMAGIDEDEPFFAEYEQLKIEQEGTLDRDARKELFKRIQEIILDESWSVQIAKRMVPFGLQAYVNGFYCDPDGKEYFGETWLNK